MEKLPASVADWPAELLEEVRFLEGDSSKPRLKTVYWTRPHSAFQDRNNQNIAFWHPGIGEHTGRYKHVAWALLSQVKTLDAVVSYDMRCHGESDGVKGKIVSMVELEDDLRERVLPAVCNRCANMNLVLMGHSLGGLLIAELCTRTNPLLSCNGVNVRSIFLSAPAVTCGIPGRVNRILAPFVHIMAAVPLTKGITKSNGITGDQISHDPNIQEQYDGGDILLDNSLSFGLASTMLRKGEEILRSLSNNSTALLKSVPVLIVHGEDDTIAIPEGSRKLYYAIQGKNVERVVISGSFHEMHCELAENGRTAFFEKLITFVQSSLQTD